LESRDEDLSRRIPDAPFFPRFNGTPPVPLPAPFIIAGKRTSFALKTSQRGKNTKKPHSPNNRLDRGSSQEKPFTAIHYGIGNEKNRMTRTMKFCFPYLMP
jgi:hypothetical protein